MGLRSVELVRGSCFASDLYVPSALITVDAMSEMEAFGLTDSLITPGLVLKPPLP